MYSKVLLFLGVCPLSLCVYCSKHSLKLYSIPTFADAQHATFHLLIDCYAEYCYQFLLTVASRNLTFSEEAESLLKGYFVTSRKIHEGSPKKRHFPLSALQTL